MGAFQVVVFHLLNGDLLSVIHFFIDMKALTNNRLHQSGPTSSIFVPFGIFSKFQNFESWKYLKGIQMTQMTIKNSWQFYGQIALSSGKTYR
jgi:hypothetical protein